MFKAIMDYVILILLTLYSLVFVIASTLLMTRGVGERSEWKKVALGFGIFLVYYISFPLVKKTFKKHYQRIKKRNQEKDSEEPGHEDKPKGQ
ncbi:hypothetical protein [Haloplasma contractile]|uniref:Uncharacterized protein n=1 Tax=Haloplasma contractile SSD-17B TaxID=1033810 RepID=F7PWJ1_9MOLU|nr:hypothetical protein [Haloplasma contractile]ERJ10971.1 hypothetical protein HLPCO_002976 [Haloplasma contractile SSD-17B]